MEWLKTVPPRVLRSILFPLLLGTVGLLGTVYVNSLRAWADEIERKIERLQTTEVQLARLEASVKELSDTQKEFNRQFLHHQQDELNFQSDLYKLWGQSQKARELDRRAKSLVDTPPPTR